MVLLYLCSLDAEYSHPFLEISVSHSSGVFSLRKMTQDEGGMTQANHLLLQEINVTIKNKVRNLLFSLLPMGFIFQKSSPHGLLHMMSLGFQRVAGRQAPMQCLLVISFTMAYCTKQMVRSSLGSRM